MNMNIADWLIASIEFNGCNRFFTVPGGGAMFLIDALAKQSKSVETISCLHEQTASIAAEYSYRLNDSQNFGVCIVTSGPGSTNALTGLVGAWLESIPVMFISGQAKSSDLSSSLDVRQVGVQEVDIISMVKSHTKYAKTWLPTDDFFKELQVAITAMNEGRKGPVWIDLPLDVQNIVLPNYDTFNEANSLFRFQPENDKISSEQKSIVKAISEKIKKSERPLLYLGHGVRLSGGIEATRNFIECLQIPFVSTWNASDIQPFDHPLNMGKPGVVAERFSNFSVQSCDLILCVGTHLNNVLTAYNPGEFARSAKEKIIVNIDMGELNFSRLNNPTLIQMDAKKFLVELNKYFLAPLEISEWKQNLLFLKNKYRKEVEIEDTDKDGRILHYSAVNKLSKLIPPERLIVTGSSGLAVEAFYVSFRNKKNQRLAHTSALGSMGYAIPAAIGAAHENGIIYCIEGDGSLQMNLQDLGTLKDTNSAVCLIIFNNNGYASIRATQRGYFESRYLGTGPEGGRNLPKLNDIATLYNLDYHLVEKITDLDDVIATFEEKKQSCLIEILITPNEALFPKCKVFFDKDMVMHSMPLEDMSPLLPIDVLRRDTGLKPLNISFKAREKNDG